jgi:prepilin peptidase CpaA
MSVALIVLIAGTLFAAVSDLRTHRIPNVLTATLGLAAIAFHLVDGMALVLTLAVMIAAFALAALAFSAGWLGGGDVKLIAAACGLASYPGCITLVLFILIAGAVLALGQALRRGRLVALVRSASNVAVTGAQPATPTLLPYGVAIAGGSAAYALSTLFPALRLAL